MYEKLIVQISRRNYASLMIVFSGHSCLRKSRSSAEHPTPRNGARRRASPGVILARALMRFTRTPSYSQGLHELSMRQAILLPRGRA
jgi:hypothetical protein